MLLANNNTQESLFTAETRQTLVVSDGVQIREQGGVRTMFVAGIPVFRYHIGDLAAEKLLCAQLLDLGLATPRELEPVVSLANRSIHRARKDYLDGGVDALIPKRRGPKGPRMGEAREASIRQWSGEGMSQHEMARRLEVSQPCVRDALVRMGLPTDRRKCKAVQGELLAQTDVNLETVTAEQTSVAEGPASSEHLAVAKQPGAEPEPVEGTAAAAAAVSQPGSLDPDPDNRVIDRMLAYKGELNDAAPLFKDRVGLSRLGVLLAVPLIVQSGVLDAARSVHGDIGPAFYGLRTSLMTLLFMGLLRIKNAESLKRYNPIELGWAMGLDRAPEVKTVRRKLSHLADDAASNETFLRELVERRVAAREQALGFLYLDGHVRAYSGKADLPKAHVARMRISMPATQELWINDADGVPLFFVTQEAHKQLVGELPGVLSEIRELVGPDRRVTVVFDRGGWSPKLFAHMDATGFDVLTYRKGKVEPLATDLFTTAEVPGSGGKEHYALADTKVEVGAKRFEMRQVTRRTVNSKGEEHQTHIVTTRRDLPAVQVAYRMFERWRQENFFKYMREQFAIDALVQYGTEPADREREVPNPEYKAVTKKLTVARAELRRLQAEYGTALADNDEKQRRTVRGLKIATGKTIGVPLREAEKLVAELEAERAAIPKRVLIGSVKDEVVQLARSRKQLSDGLKMLAYQIETDLVTLITPHYKRASHEGRPLLTSALQSSGDLMVQDGELRVTLAPQSSPHRTRAVAALCAELDATQTQFPGTNLRLRFAVADPDRANSAPP